MNGELAQYFALATHATAWLRDRQTASAVLEASHSTLKFVRAVTFDGVPDIDAWVRQQAETGVDRVWLAVPRLDPLDDRGGLAAHLGAAFAGGVQAGLLTNGRAGSRLWRAHWQVGDRDAPDRRIWAVAYQSQPVDFRPQRPDLQSAAQILERALQRAEEFSVRHDLQPWDGLFAQARRQWSGSGDPQRVCHSDLLADGCANPHSRRLADMAQAAWVFGGMGSWNDLGFAEQDVHDEYERISRDLFAAVMRACVAAANADLRSA